jgi:hypothetical protein
MDNAQFRTDFPEFGDVTRYPDAQLTLWMSVGIARLNQTRWNAVGLYNIGLELLTAHYLVLAKANQDAAEGGAVPGQATSVKSGKSVGDVSVSIDTSIGSDPRAASLNLTDYGKRFHELAMTVGIGGAQL